MKLFLVLIMSLTYFTSRGQKETVKVLDAARIGSIVIAADEVFKITISTAPVKTITIKTRADGEYYNNIGLDVEIQQEMLFLRSQFREILRTGFDKLSAHKVFALQLELEVPENLEVEIVSNLASVYASGSYEKLLIQLKFGSCYLEDFSGNAVVETLNGNIEVETYPAFIEANSRNGTVEIRGAGNGEHKIILNSINGNISVKKTK